MRAHPRVHDCMRVRTCVRAFKHARVPVRITLVLYNINRSHYNYNIIYKYNIAWVQLRYADASPIDTPYDGQ